MKKQHQADFLHESNKIEGYDIAHFQYLKCMDGKEVHRQLVKNSVDAIKLVFDLVDNGEDLRPGDVCHLHMLQMKGMLESAGRLRFENEVVQIGDAIPPCGTVMHCMMETWLGDLNDPYEDFTPLALHYRFERIHPFCDGNGRVGRLLWLYDVLKRGKDVPPTFLDQYSGKTFKDRQYKYYDSIGEY